MNINYDSPFNFKPIPSITPASDYWQNSTWKFNMPEITVSTGTTPSWQDIILSGKTALTLTNALANGLNYLKLFGGTEQRNIPSGYTQVEYLESSGTQYIDLGYPIDGTMSFSLKTRCLTTGFVFGSRSNNTTNVSSLNYDSVNNLFGIRMGNTIVYNSTSWTENTDYEIYISDGDTKIDGTTVSTTAYGTSFYSGNAYLFTLNNNGAPGSPSFNINRIYYFQMFKNGVLTQNLIPCKNSLNVLGMYDTVTGTFFTNAGTGTFTAGSDTVPTPDTPMDIVCNNGVVKYGVIGKNLFDKSDIITGKILNDTGAPVEQSSGYYSGHISVNASTEYTISQTNGIGIYFRILEYDSTNTMVKLNKGTIEGTQTKTFTTEANTVYVIVSGSSSGGALDTVQLELGSTATAYEPYQAGIYTDGTVETVEITGKNLFDYEYFYDNYQTYSISSVGRCPIKLQQNTTYTVSTNKEVTSGSSSIFVVSGSAIDWTPLSNENGVFVNKPRTVTTDSNGYLCLGFYVVGYNAIPESYFINGTAWVQIEQGSSATPYEPYFNGGTASAEMLLKVGDYKDVQSVIDGGVTRKVGVLVFDGTEDWNYNSQFSRFYTAILPHSILQERARSIPAYCTHFQMLSNGESISDITSGQGYVTRGSSVSPSYVYLHSSLTTPESFKQYLADQYAAGTPVIVVYPLAEPTTETVTGQPLTTQAGTNIVSITQASIDNLELEVSFKQSTI